MNKLITICFFIVTVFTVNGQTLKGSCYDNGQGTSSYFSQVDLNATFSFYAKNNLVYIICSNLRMNVPSNTTYNAYGKTYTKSDLGISQWPQNQKPWSMTINVSGSYIGGSFNKSISCSANFTCDEFHIEGIRADQVNVSSFKISTISNFTYNQGGDPQLEELIKQKNKQESQKTNSSSTASTNSESSNSLDTSQSSTTETTSQIPSLESQYAKLGIPANTPTYTKQEVTTKLVTQGVDLVAGILTELGEEKRQKEAYQAQLREAQAERERAAAAAAQIRREKIATHTNFITAFKDAKLPLSSSNIEENVIYYFAFSADKSALATTNPIIKITDIFPITKYNDDTWPFSVNIKKEISNVLKSTDIVLIGYYKSKTEAETDYFKFKNSLEKLNFLIASYNYKGKIKESDSNDDIWDDSPNKTAKKTTNEADDFWEESKKEEKGKKTKPQSTPVNKTPTKKETPKTKTDNFWEN